MKYLTLVSVLLLLTGCGEPKSTLPPELLNLAENTQTRDLPFPTEDIETSGPNTPTEVSDPEEADTSPEAPSPKSNTQTPSSLQPESKTTQCQNGESELKEAFEDINFCETDNDCKVAMGACPFGCHIFYNKALSFIDYKNDMDEWKNSCGGCTYKCAPPPTRMKCVEGQCQARI